MSSPFGDREDFGETLRSIAREIGDSIERLAGDVDVNDFAGYVGVDPDRAREWIESAASWLGSQVGHLGDEVAARASQSQPKDRPADPFSGVSGEDVWREAAPHPLDLPSEEQGMALAALDSGRWTVEAGSNRLIGEGESRPPGDSPGLVRELRARDWITADGRLTRAGRHALDRWLDASASH
jgi:hypothetical protein